MPLPLRLKIRLGIVIGTLCVPILLLLITMIPGVFMFETSFFNQTTLSIDTIGGPGITQISVSFAAFSLTMTMPNPTHYSGVSGKDGRVPCNIEPTKHTGKRATRT